MKLNTQKFQNAILKASGWVQRNAVMQAIKNAFIRTIPFTIVGSFSNVIKMQLDQLIKSEHLTSPILTNISNLFGYLNLATIGIIGIIVVLSSAYSYANELKPKNPDMNIFLATILALTSYFVMVPNNVNYALSKAKVVAGFPTGFFDYGGMFTGLIVGMVSVYLYAKLSHSKIKIKMPESVPQNIFDAFAALVPIAGDLLLWGIIRIIIQSLGYPSVLEMISTVLVAPLTKVGTGLPAIIVVILAEQIFWFLGLHGFNIVWGVVSAFWLPIYLQQCAKYAATQSFKGIMIAPNTMTNVYAMIGGSGATFGLLLAMLIFTKKGEKDNKVAKLAFIPGCFGINEPIIFGLPIVLNPIMFIPWILVPLTNAIIAYVVTKIGWVVPLVVLNSGSEPIFFSTWLTGAFHTSPVVLTAVLVALDTVMYAPFVILNRKAELAEQNQPQAAEAV